MQIPVEKDKIKDIPVINSIRTAKKQQQHKIIRMHQSG